MSYVYKISYDDSPESPREWSNVGTMVCFHPRYNLGDEQPKCSPDEYLRDLACQADPKLADTLEWLEDRGLEDRYRKAIERTLDRHYLMKELFLYDHSGITMSTGHFACPWDSGQVGFIYVSKARAREEYGFKRLDRINTEKVMTYLDGEVETYDQFLTGQVYGYRVYYIPQDYQDQYREDEGLDEDEAIDWQALMEDDELDEKELEELDSCWGIYGDDYAKDEAKSMVEWHQEHHAERMLKIQQQEFARLGQLELPAA